MSTPLPTKNWLTKQSDFSLAISDQLVRQNRNAAKATETKRALLKHWRLFTLWCDTQQHNAMPASLDAVEHFLLYLADQHESQRASSASTSQIGMGTASIEQALWAINTRHRLGNHPPPGEHIQIKTALTGIRRRKGKRQKQQTPLLLDTLKKLQFPDTIRGVRDRALVLVGLGACLRRSELALLQCDDVVPTPTGLKLFIAFSKTDQQGQGSWVDLVRANTPSLCPVEALQNWLKQANIKNGLLFRAVRKGSPPAIQASMAAATVDSAVKQAIERVGLNPQYYGAHSLRAGKATIMAEQGISPILIARHGRWKSMDMVLRYCRVETTRALEGLF